MKTILITVLLVALGLGPAAAAPMGAEDRQRLIAHFEMTERWLSDEVSGLSPAQLSFRMAPGTWSIMDVVEHLTIAEPQYWQSFQEASKRPTMDKPEAGDAGILWYGIDRTKHAKTGDARVPKGQLTDIGKGLESFRKLRAGILDYVRSTQDDLRGHAYPDSGMDGYQWLLMITAHSQRHILQIREIKAHSGFPRK